MLSISGNSASKHLKWSTPNEISECFGRYLFVIMQPQMPPGFCHFKSGIARDFFFFPFFLGLLEFFFFRLLIGKTGLF